jgi:integrase
MGSIQVRKESGRLIIDFYLQGHRCREQTALPDTVANRNKLQKILDRIETEIKLGTFDYARYFPGSRMAGKISGSAAVTRVTVASPAVVPAMTGMPTAQANTGFPTFKEFAKTWVAENEVAWRRSHRKTVDDILTRHLLPAFGEKGVGEITKADILTFRSSLAKVPGRKAETLSAKRINAILAPLRQILNEAADRFEFTTAFRNIKPLKVLKADVEPFTLEEVQKILCTVRPDFRNYYAVRFFTGMRTGEIDGLKWKYVDFERRQILVRETIVAGEEDTTKTEGSQREIQMSQRVFDALQEQAQVTRSMSDYVFCTASGQPLDHNNVTKRVWYPLLRYLAFKPRRPYQSRHTAATLWLAAGENPLWIARQLGHSSTEMLFKVYGRFVPNLTRQDGSAFERLLLQTGTASTSVPVGPSAANEAQAPSANTRSVGGRP